MSTVNIFNTLESKVVPFAPADQRRIKWYTCGPTVYDASHLGHARNYISQDIIRRILEDYLGYEVELVMNITDIDDKIILRSQDAQIPIKDLTTKYEKEFFRDMDRLYIKRPSMVTRVSEYIPQIIAYIQRIIDNGFAYPSNGSVYFDMEAYSKKFPYGRLHSVDNEASHMSGRLKDKNVDKRSQTDFALWKKSHDTEPSWPSSWGSGRPGWHVECSVMSSAILGSSFDIHSGGEDLKFPHHENELAQACAHNNTGNWVRYFVHTGHLHINGCKMAKSLKNFITIETALKDYTPRQIRILFLLHHYRDILNYSPETMRTAITTENSIQEFLNQTRALLDKSEITSWAIRECSFRSVFYEIQDHIDLALRDDFDTPKVFEHIGRLIKQTYIYMNSLNTSNVYLIRSIRNYLERILRILGLDFEIRDTGSVPVLALLDTVTDFRNNLRQILKDPQYTEVKTLKRDIFKISDHYRDVILPGLGMHIDDTAAGKAIWKIK